MTTTKILSAYNTSANSFTTKVTASLSDSGDLVALTIAAKAKGSFNAPTLTAVLYPDGTYSLAADGADTKLSVNDGPGSDVIRNTAAASAYLAKEVKYLSKYWDTVAKAAAA